jgi:hypothetical protein
MFANPTNFIYVGVIYIDLTEGILYNSLSLSSCTTWGAGSKILISGSFIIFLLSDTIFIPY